MSPDQNSLTTHPAIEGYLLNPRDALEMSVQIGEILCFLDAERVGVGKPIAGAVLVVALDTLYEEC